MNAVKWSYQIEQDSQQYSS
uniref:Uncharacterized protein n=1 Tax=Arundo donax TaxID=35708 RepID=A0A0A9FHY5_ARUDO